MYEQYPPALGAPLPDLPGLPPVDATEVVGGLKWVRSDVRPAAIQVIGTMTQFQPTGGFEANTRHGVAVPMVAMPSSENWVERARQTVNVVLVKPSASGQQLDVIVTNSPAVVAANAGVLFGGQYAILDGHSSVIDAAGSQLPPPGVEPGPGPLPGIPGVPGVPTIPPVPGLPSPGPGAIPGYPTPSPAAPASSKLPGWVVPVVIGTGAVAVVGLVVASRKRYAANRRRRARRRR